MASTMTTRVFYLYTLWCLIGVSLPQYTDHWMDSEKYGIGTQIINPESVHENDSIKQAESKILQELQMCSTTNQSVQNPVTRIDSRYYLKKALQIRQSEPSNLELWLWLHKWMTNCLTEFNKSKTANHSYVLQVDEKIEFLDEDVCKYKIGDEHELNINLTKLWNVYQHIEVLMNTYEQFVVIRNLTMAPMSDSLKYLDCKSSAMCQCISSDNLQYIQEKQVELQQMYSQIKRLYILRRHIEPGISLTIFIIGLILDGTLLFIFVWHREVRTRPNILVLNMVINDLLCMMFVLPLKHFVFNYHHKETILNIKFISFEVSQILVSLVSAFSILALSTQRYFAISRSFKCIIRSCNQIRLIDFAIYILPVWGNSLVIITILFLMSYQKEMVKAFDITFAVVVIFIAVILPIIVSAINIETAHKLRKSAQNVPGESQSALINSRYRSSNILIGLSIVFWITHSPYFSWLLMFRKIRHVVPRYVPCAIYHFFFLNSILNPLTLYVTSATFRALFNKYLFRWWYEKIKIMASRSVIRTTQDNVT